MLINVDIHVFDSTVVLFHNIHELGFHDLAWAAPRRSSLDEHRSRGNFHCFLPVFGALHLLNVCRAVQNFRAHHSELGSLKEKLTSTNSWEGKISHDNGCSTSCYLSILTLKITKLSVTFNQHRQLI